MSSAFFRPVVKLFARRALLLGMCLLVAVLGGRMYFGSLPKTAPASSFPAMEPMIEPVDRQARLSPAQAALQEWLRTPVAPLSRNVISFHSDNSSIDTPAAGHGAADGGFREAGAKSVEVRADEQNKRKQILDSLVADAAELRLQSTIMGAEPTALVNGKLVREGDVVALFRVVKIEARGIIVEQKGIKLEIQFNAPAVQ